MEKVKYLVLGAGPAGLSVACRLKQLGIDSILVLEKESQAGGLCRSEQVDGAPLDIGGGHFLDVRRPKVNEFLFGFMPQSEWDFYTRDSKILFDGQYYDHPFEANIWQFPQDKQVAYLKSIAVAGCNLETPMPDKFVDWIYWKLGERVAEDYMLPYNRKMFGDNLNDLGTYWLEKLPNVSFEETLLSCLNRKPYGEQPGHASFYYPKKYGYGELWLRMQQELGDKIICNVTVSSLDFDTRRVTAADGQVYEAEHIITTIPWESIETCIGMPGDVLEAKNKLRSSAVEIKYYPENMDTSAQWIYYPDPKLSYHRILVRHNFCPNSRGYWTETNINRIEKDDTEHYSYINEYAYPLNTLDKPESIGKVLAFARTKGVYGLGRWGEHEHYNSDLTVELAMNMAQMLYSK